MENQDYKDDIIINESIEGSDITEVVRKINTHDPHLKIRDLIALLIREFELPMMDNDGTPYQYHLGKLQSNEEIEILFEEDENGNQLCLLDYDVKLNDHLLLVLTPVLYGCIPPEEINK